MAVFSNNETVCQRLEVIASSLLTLALTLDRVEDAIKANAVVAQRDAMAIHTDLKQLSQRLDRVEELVDRNAV